MVTPDLLEFIRAQHDVGMTKDALLAMLVAEGGWTSEDIDEAYQALFGVPAPIATPPEPIVAQTTSVDLPIVEPIVAPSAVTEPEPIPQIIVPEEVTVEPVIEPSTQTPEPQPAPVIPFVVVPTNEPIAEVANSLVQPLPQITPESTPVLPHEHSPEDDFLGIFGGTPEPVSIPVITPPETTTEVLAGRPVALVRPELAPVQAPVTPPEIVAEITPVLGAGMDLSAVSDADTPAIVPAPITRTGTFSSMLAGTPLTSVGAGASSGPIKFNLSSIHKESAPATTPAPATPAAIAPISVTPKRSLTESLQVAGVPKVETPPPAQVVMQPTLAISTEVVAPATPAVKSGGGAKRTMASDLLLRGMGGSNVSGMPALSTPDEVPMRTEADILHEQELAKAKEAEKAEIAVIVKKNNTKRLLGLIIGVLVLLGVVGLAFFAFTKFQGPGAGSLFAAAETQFYGLKTFSYKGDAKIDLVLSTATDGIERSGIVKFALTYAGSLFNDQSGYGDGVHHVKLSGGLQSGNFAWPTDIESDIRVVGTTLYFRVLSFPETSNLDPELFKTYWIKVGLSDIAKELALSGLGASEGYGSFGGQSNDTTWNALLLKNAPFEIFEEKSTELPDGTKVQHVTLHANPDNIVGFATALYRKYLSKDLVLSSEQQLRLKNALSKIVGEIWISESTGMIVKTSWSGNFDDDMLEAHVKGTIRIDIDISEQNKELVVASPTPILTLDELKVRMEDFQKITEAQARDQEKIDRAKSLVSALEAYRKARGRYPTALPDLYGAGMLASSTIPTARLKNYNYSPYVNADSVSKTGRCALKAKICAYYQLGVNLEYKDNPILLDDADVIADIRGGDETGCAGELDFACYDLVPPGVTTATTPPASGAETPAKAGTP